jgi:integrase
MSHKRTTAASAILPHPRKDYRDCIQLVQHRRGPAVATWEARYRINGAWSGWNSLGTDLWDDAIFIAVDRLAEREQAAKAGLTSPTRKKRETNTVNEIALVTLARLEAEKKAILGTQPAKKANKVSATIGRIKSIILPALGDRGVANVTEDDLERFRQSHTVNGRRPKQGTISHLNSAWKEILRDAVKLGHVSKRHAKRSIISQEGFAKGNRGSTFSVEEMQAIRAYMTDAWVDEFNQIKVREARYLLRAMTSLMASTGITPGLEVETLTPAQIAEVSDSNGRLGLRITVRKAQGKRKNDRVVWARSHDVWPVLQDVRDLLAWITANATEDYRRNNPHGYLFSRPSDGLLPTKFAGVFADVLDRLRLRRDLISGVFRTMYSCRHYYATQSLMDGVSITFLAENMGNSEAMIRTHYSHVITDLRSGQLTGSRRVVEWHQRLREMPHPVDPWETARDIAEQMAGR